jgi:hypothetical protein
MVPQAHFGIASSYRLLLTEQHYSFILTLTSTLPLVGLISLNNGHYAPSLYTLAAEKLSVSLSKLYHRYHGALTEMLIIVAYLKLLMLPSPSPAS